MKLSYAKICNSWKYICVFMGGGLLGAAIGERRVTLLTLIIAVLWSSVGTYFRNREMPELEKVKQEVAEFKRRIETGEIRVRVDVITRPGDPRTTMN